MHVFFVVAAAVSGVAAYTDVRTGHIPNAVTVPALVAGVMAHVVTGYADGGSMGALRGAGAAALGVVACGLLPTYAFARRAMGGGDVKLFAALGAWCGALAGLEAQAYAFVAALLLATAWLALRGELAGVVRRAFTPAWRRRSTEPAALDQHWLRMGPSIFAGVATMILSQGLR